MKSKLLLVLTIISYNSFSQNTQGVSISNNVSPPHESAMLEVSSKDKGILIPRVDLDDLTDNTSPILNPAEGLMVYNVYDGDLKAGFYFWSNNQWNLLAKEKKDEEWKIIGTSGTMDNGEPIPQYKTGFSIPNYNHTNERLLSIRKKSDGTVEIRGNFEGNGGPIFDLPIGYIPLHNERGTIVNQGTYSTVSGGTLYYGGENRVQINYSLD